MANKKGIYMSQNSNKKRKSAKEILEDYFQKSYELIVDNGQIEDQDIIDWGNDVGEEVWSEIDK